MADQQRHPDDKTMADHQHHHPDEKPKSTVAVDHHHQQPPPDEKPKTMVAVDHQQQPPKPMGDDKQQEPPPPDEKPVIVAAARYPVAEVARAVALLTDIKARLGAAPAARDELLGLLAELGRGRGDARAVASRVEGILREHLPDAMATLAAFVTGAGAPVAQSLAATRPRRRRKERDRRSAAEEAGGGGGEQVYRPPRKRDKEQRASRRHEAAAAGGGAREDDPRLAEAHAFLHRVRDIAGDGVLRELGEVLDEAWRDQDMAADVIYRRAGEALGPSHGGLLHEFAAAFLPGEEEWAAQEARRRLAPKRNRPAAVAASPPLASDKKPPRADDGNHRQHNAFLGGGAAARAHQHDAPAVVATMEIVQSKKRRAAADGSHQRRQALVISEGPGNQQHAPRVTIKRPRAADDGHRPCNGHRPQHGDCNGGVVHGNGDNNQKKPRRRNAPNPAPPPPPESIEEANKRLFREFRELTVFYSYYTDLVETIRRAEKLLAAAGARLPATVEELFPRRGSRELLGKYYDGQWGDMIAKLEGGKSKVPALRVVLDSLRVEEEEAVAEELRKRWQEDAARAAGRRAGLVKDRVGEEERRHDGGAGASGQSACYRR